MSHRVTVTFEIVVESLDMTDIIYSHIGELADIESFSGLDILDVEVSEVEEEDE